MAAFTISVSSAEKVPGPIFIISPVVVANAIACVSVSLGVVAEVPLFPEDPPFAAVST